MSLRAKIALILAGVVLAYAGVDHIAQRALILESFLSIERAQAKADLHRALMAIDSERAHLDQDCAASAASQETYRFATEGDASVLEEHILPQLLRGRELALLYVCDLRGRVVWGSVRDPVTQRPITLRDFPSQALAPTHPLMPTPQRPRVSGVLQTEAGPLLVSSQPIVGNEPGAPARGTLILGRRLDPDLVERLAEQSGVRFALWPIDASDLPASLAAVRDEAAASQQEIVVPVDDEHLLVSTALSDVRGRPILLASAQVDRDVSANGTRAVRYALISTVAAGLLLLLVLLNLLQRAVVQPLGKLTHHALEIGRSEDFTRRIGLQREDEIGLLASEFDRLIERVEQSRAALVKAARAAGMSEIATGVLHNVGNVLNSVNVSASMVGEELRRSAADDLAKVVAALEPHQDDLAGHLARDPRSRHLVPLLRSIVQDLGAQRERLQGEVRSMCDGVEHIKQLVAAQQGYAGRSGVLEVLRLSDLLESALSFTAQAGAGHGGVEVVRELEDLPACHADRHRLMEVLVNLIQNARQSMLEAGVAPRLVLRLARKDDERAVITVEDNGVGIAPENLARVFTHGFTTKKTGHGFGLHASANAAREMGGSLTAHSDGPGRGAAFVLEIPFRAAQARGVAA